MQKGLPLRSSLAEVGQAQVLILAGIVLVLALAGGIFYLGRISAPKPQNVATSSPQPSPTLSPTTSPDPTANWKTYTDDQLGISFKYAPDYTVAERATEKVDYGQDNSFNQRGAIFIGTKSNDQGFTMVVWENPDKLDVKTWWEINSTKLYGGLNTKELKMITRNAGQNLVLTPEGDLPGQGNKYYMAFEDKVIEMRSTAGKEADSTTLSTFRFD